MKSKSLAAAAAVCALGGAGLAVAQITSSVPNAQPRSGQLPDIVASGFSETAVATGTDPLENPTALIASYGFLNDASASGTGFATGTEPDINTFLKTATNPGGTDANFDYGRNFLFQGHENANNNRGSAATAAYLTRINLDVPKGNPHRITLLSPDTTQAAGRNLQATSPGNTGMTRIDGSGFDPFNGEMLFTGEGNNTTGGVFASPLNWNSTTPPQVKQYTASMGRGGYEGIHPDSSGNIWIVEDSGGNNVSNPATGATNQARQPNSFIYRFVPDNPGDLSAGKLQALQVGIGNAGITFHAGDPGGADTYGAPIAALHSGAAQNARLVTIHDTNNSPSNWGSFNGVRCPQGDANCAAKSAGATPFKRPETGNFVPGSNFQSFVFGETGDTNAFAGNDTDAAARGSWGALLQVDLPAPGASTGMTIRAIEIGDAQHASFDNVSFLDATTLLAAEDRGETLHQQLNALDSLWAFDITKPLSQINGDAKRLVAQGRDATATQSAPSVPPECTGAPRASNCPGAAAPFFQNDGDNEITGIHVSDGGVTVADLQGTNPPSANSRIFYTQQHGDNTTYEIKRGAAATPTTPAAPAKPAVVVLKVSAGKVRGAVVSVSVSVSGAGSLSGKLLDGKKVISKGSATATKAGRVTLRFRLSKATRARIKKKGGTTGTIKVTFKPTSGVARTGHSTVALKGA